MKKNIAVFAKDKYLRQKIYLILSPWHDVRCADTIDPPARGKLDCDIVIWNLDDMPLPEGAASRFVTLGSGGDVPLPFTEQMLVAAVNKIEGKASAEIIVRGEKCAYIYGKTVRLTDMEYALFSVLFEAGGEFVTREELIRMVWGDSATDGILNVYIHYLREKIEFRGEKIILSSRKFGYKIDERFLSKGGDE